MFAIAQRFWLPAMEPDARDYVEACFVCARNKNSSRTREGLLQPLPIPSRPWAEISGDFVTGLPTSNGNTPLLTVFIAALLNSVLFSTVIYPQLLIDFLSEKHIISYPACLFQWFLNYWLAASDFFLLSVIAYDRYVYICNPLQYTTIMQKTTVNIFLFSAWILPACQVSVAILLSAKKEICKYHLKGILCNSTVQKLHCVRSRILNLYGLVGIVSAVFLPVLFILFIYSRILVVSYRCRGVRRRAAQTCLPHLLVLINFSCLSAYNVLVP
uniref:olfactory receptor 4Q2-like n=1 Tax=Gasterosteus aculeatus aculeatus TaxID=481459 RepID=UPI001A982452|nr:olfactory receptor 4Q2-like [Gasterosteus aculeatus aculeatus]